MTIAPARICINCGHDPATKDLSGCGNDTQWSHTYENVDSAPFESWSVEGILARIERASRKGASAALTAEHFADCPSEGLGFGSPVHQLYVQKAAKRLNLAAALAAELMRRAEGTG